MANQTEEQTILAFLTDNAQLQDFCTRREFLALVPKRHRNDPRMTALYHELEHARARQVRTVMKNVRLEAEMSLRMLDEEDRQEDDDEDEDGDIYTELLADKNDRVMTATEEIAELESSVAKMTSELEAIDEDSNKMLDECNEIISSLSDLQYKKLPGNVMKDLIGQLNEMAEMLEGSSQD
ncbi:hypothetical protein V1512DRAFT_259330 [Lipomyces arxii]|uniref:uncharacterized protein n=1 Tax=Lipomyces arxii TaxID=56418 RepID=UPI0034D019FA